MAKAFYTGVSGVARKNKGAHIGVAGVARKIKSGYVGVNSVARQFFAGTDPVFSNNTWAQIISACQNGNVPDTWLVGDQKTMTINGTDYAIDIIGKNHDDYADGSGKAPLTFQMHDCYEVTKKMNTSNIATNSGGWKDCDMRSTNLPAILSLMPDEVQVGIKEVNKMTSEGSLSSTINTTADKLFLLSEIEIFGNYSNSKSGEGSQYAYYSAGNSKVKNISGSACYWWERSPHSGDNTNFCIVSSSGIAFSNTSRNSRGVSFAFCF